MTAISTSPRKATLYRMVMPEHLCPYGLKARALLQAQGFDVEDRWLTTREATERFKADQGVKTTPQTFIDGQRVGGYDDLRRYLGKADPNATSYRPVIAVFGVAAALALALSYATHGGFERTAEWFVSLSMTLLAMLKLQDVETFSTMFLNYDLLARRFVPYAYVYPFAEALAGVLMTAHALKAISVPVALFIGTIGAASVLKAVYIDKRELKCACVGGAGKTPLGFVSLTENLFMVAMALWMLARA